MTSFSFSVFNGKGSRGGGTTMTNPRDTLRRQAGSSGNERRGGPGSFNPASRGAQFSVTGGNSDRNRGRREVLIREKMDAARAAMRQARG